MAADQFYFYNPNDTAITVQVKKSYWTAPTITLETSTDNETWTALGNTSDTALDISIPAKSRVYLRSTSANAWGSSSYQNSFSCASRFEAHGSIMTLLGYDTLKGYDCDNMFAYCTGLTVAPELPATTLANSCYGYMFNGCTSLTGNLDCANASAKNGNWLKNTQGGTLHVPAGSTVANVPSQWTVVYDYSPSVWEETSRNITDYSCELNESGERTGYALVTVTVTYTNTNQDSYRYGETKTQTLSGERVLNYALCAPEGHYLDLAGLSYLWNKIKVYVNNMVATGGVEVIETDPVFVASVAHSITQSMIDGWNGKQAALVSGTNIKTVNGNSLLGSGDITIEGGGTSGGGDENVIETVKVNNTALTPDANKAVNITVPTSLSGLTDDATHRVVTDTEKTTWNGKYTKPSGGIPKTDLATSVQTSLGKADTALQSHQDISGKANTADLAAVATSGSYNDLTNKPTIPTVPTNVGAFTNDAGYITASQVPTELPTVGASDSGKILTVNSSGQWVAASIAMQRYYSGSAAPSNAQGENGDLYLQTN